MKIDPARETALKILYDINENGAYSNISLDRHMEEAGLKDLDKAFITEMVYGTIKWRLTIDWVISSYSTIKLKKISPWILNILRLGIYQLLYMNKIPVSAACNESVILARRYGHKASGGYVNAIMRKVAGQRENLPFPERSENLPEHLSVRYSHPLWMVKSWLDRYGAEFTEALLGANNGVAEFSIRVNTLKTDAEGLIQTLAEEGLPSIRGDVATDGLIILPIQRGADQSPRDTGKSVRAVRRLSAHGLGQLQVQDQSSMLVSQIMDPQPGEVVMDVCSAPGGKSTHMAQLMKDMGLVLARDIHPHKLKLVEEAAGRLGITIIRTELFDAAVLDGSMVQKVDRVLVDAPCTGFGIIRRKPDIKWTRSEKDKAEIVELQERILQTCSAYVKKGGTLIYSTCTLEPEENEEQVERFLKANPDFIRVDISHRLPAKLRKDSASKGYVQLYPNMDGVDGFFISSMRRIGPNAD